MHSPRSARGPLAALSLAMLLPSLGTSVANVALPTLATSFSASFHDVQWVVIAYLLAVTTLVVVAGRIGDMIGRRRVLLAGIALFTLASIAAVFAPSLFVLIVARASQGVGAAIMMALTVASVGDVVPPERTGRAMGLLGTVSAIGTALGPSLGGVLLATTGWPGVFAVMAASGGAALLLGYWLFPRDPAPAPAKKGAGLDLAGMAVLALSLGAYALAATRDAAGFGSSGVLLVLAAAIGLTIFLAIERSAAAPLLPLAMLRDGGLSTGLIAIGLVSAIVMATLVVGPFYLSGVLGLPPAGVGLVMSVGPGIAALTGLPSGALTDRFGALQVAVLGLVGVALGALLMMVLPGAFGVAGYLGSIAAITAGYALFQAANSTSLMKGVASERRGVTSSLIALARNLGLVTGASVMGGVFAFGSTGAVPGLAPAGAGGLQLTFAAASLLAGLALAATLLGKRRRLEPCGED